MNTNKFSWVKVAKQVLGKKAVQKVGDGINNSWMIEDGVMIFDAHRWRQEETCEVDRQQARFLQCSSGCLSVYTDEHF